MSAFLHLIFNTVEHDSPQTSVHLNKEVSLNVYQNGQPVATGLQG